VSDSMYDLVIRGGTIVDGSGSERFVGDVAVRGGWIVATARSRAVVRRRCRPRAAGHPRFCRYSYLMTVS